MIRIRLQRLGRKKSPFYRIVAVDGRKKRDGATLALLGYYNPLSRELKLDKEEANAWVAKGAQFSETAERLYKLAADTPEVIVLPRPEREKLSKKAKAKLEEEAAAKAAAEEKAKEEAAAEAAKASAKEEAAAEEAAAAPAVEEAPVAEATPAEAVEASVS